MDPVSDPSFWARAFLVRVRGLSGSMANGAVPLEGLANGELGIGASANRIARFTSALARATTRA
eukprot:scaffold1234_cov345-Pavlova_lutheri.AAC.2